MNILNNRNERINIFKVMASCLIVTVSFTLVSRGGNMDIRRPYPFTVEVMPVSNKVAKGQTVEVRRELKKEGDFSGVFYVIHYFQFEGEGSLKMDDSIAFLSNDHYLLENEEFRLYYTVEGNEAHDLIVVMEDNFKNSYELRSDFDNRDIKGDGFAAIPIGSSRRI